jgi:hypothetical protein
MVLSILSTLELGAVHATNLHGQNSTTETTSSSGAVTSAMLRPPYYTQSGMHREVVVGILHAPRDLQRFNEFAQ